jgi:hypothetical protein
MMGVTSWRKDMEDSGVWLPPPAPLHDTKGKKGLKRNAVAITQQSVDIAKLLTNQRTVNMKLLGLLNKRFRTNLLLCIISGFCFCFAAAEQQHLWKNENIPDITADMLKKCIGLMSIFTVFLVLRKHMLITREQKLRGILPAETTLLTNGYCKVIIGEMLFNLLHAPAYVHATYTYKVGTNDNIFAYYSLDAVMTIFIVMRCYHLLPMFHAHLNIKEAQSKMHSKLTGVSLGRLFIAKVLLKSHPLTFVFSLAFLFCCVLSYICWVFERAYCAPWTPQMGNEMRGWSSEPEIEARCSLANIDRAANIGDSFWGMMNTMTTLGASMPPLTVMGRLTSTVGLIAGLCLLALLLNATCEAMSFSPFESKVYTRLQSQKFYRMRYHRAARMIEACWYRYKAFKKKGGCASRAFATNNFCHALHRFRHYRSEGEKRKAGMGGGDSRGGGGGGGIETRLVKQMRVEIDLRVGALEDRLSMRLGRIEVALAALLPADHAAATALLTIPSPPPSPVVKEHGAREGAEDEKGATASGEEEEDDDEEPKVEKDLPGIYYQDPQTESWSRQRAEDGRGTSARWEQMSGGSGGEKKGGGGGGEKGECGDAVDGSKLKKQILFDKEDEEKKRGLGDSERKMKKESEEEDREEEVDRIPRSPQTSERGGESSDEKKEKEKKRKEAEDDEAEEEEDDDDDEDDEDDDQDFHGVVVAFYKKHNPDKVHTVEGVLKKYSGREEELLLKLRTKYNIKGSLKLPEKAKEELSNKASSQALAGMENVSAEEKALAAEALRRASPYIDGRKIPKESATQQEGGHSS